MDHVTGNFSFTLMKRTDISHRETMAKKLQRHAWRALQTFPVAVYPVRVYLFIIFLFSKKKK